MDSCSEVKELNNKVLNDAIINDDILQNHLVRVQNSLMGIVDRQLSKAEEKVHEKEIELDNANKEKKRLAIDLYKEKSNIDKLNGYISKLKTKINSLENDNSGKSIEFQYINNEVKELKKEKEKLENQVKDIKKMYDESNEKYKQLGEINEIYNSNLKIQKRIRNRMDKEINITNQIKKNAEEELGSYIKKYEMMVNENKELEQQLENQKHETIIAQNALNNMNRELNILSQSKQKFEKQWEDSLLAMVRRDSTLEEVHNNYVAAKEKLDTCEKELHACKYERDNYEKSSILKSNELMENKTLIDELKAKIISLEGRLKESEFNIQEVTAIEEKYREDISKIKLSNKLAVKEINDKKDKINELMNSIKSLNQSFKTQIKDEVIMKVGEKEEKIIKEATKEINDITRNFESTNDSLRNENARLHMKIKDLKEQIVEKDSAHEKYKCLYNQINDHYSKLNDEAQKMVNNLEMKEHDINILRQKLVDKTQENDLQHEKLIQQKLQKEIAFSKLEKERIQKLWINSQKEEIKSKDIINKLSEDNAHLKTQLRMNEIFKIKTADEINETKKEALEHQINISKLTLQLKQEKAKNKTLKDDNVKLKERIVKLENKIEEDTFDNSIYQQMAKQEIKLHVKDKKDKLNEIIENRKMMLAREKKEILLSEMNNKLREENKKLNKDIFQLKVEKKDLISKYNVLNYEHASVMNLISKNKFEIPFSKSLNTNVIQPNDNVYDHIKEANDNYMIPDIQKMMLRIDSLTSEKKYLLNENNVLKRNIEMLKNQVSTMNNNKNTTNKEIKSLKDTIKDKTNQYSTLNKKTEKAQKIAAFLENQIKELKPNYKIDYSKLNNAEPSIMLLSAFQVKDNDNDKESTGFSSTITNLPLIQTKNK
jgi:chromosome segregation ATPase